MKHFICIMTLFLFLGGFLAAQVPLNTSLSIGFFQFVTGAMADDSTTLFSAEVSLEYQIFEEFSAGLSALMLFHEAIEWHADGFIFFPMISVQYGDFKKMSHRVEFGPPFWGQTYVLFGYIFQFYQFIAGVHFYRDWEWDRTALNFQLGYQFSF